MRAKGEIEVSHEIGDYVFIKGNVPLKFLTSDSKRNIENWARNSNINEHKVKRALSIDNYKRYRNGI